MSSGGGSGEMAGGYQLDFTVGGGVLASANSAPDGHTAIFGSIAIEGY
jgi:hypothetical protein